RPPRRRPEGTGRGEDGRRRGGPPPRAAGARRRHGGAAHRPRGHPRRSAGARGPDGDAAGRPRARRRPAAAHAPGRRGAGRGAAAPHRPGMRAAAGGRRPHGRAPRRRAVRPGRVPGRPRPPATRRKEVTVPDLADRSAARTDPGESPARGLLVDDEPALRGLVTDALRGAGHEVVAAPAGATAVGLVGPHWQPARLRLDARPPDLDALAFLRAYDQTPGAHAPVVVVAAGTDAGARFRCGSFPVAEVLYTPVDLAELLTAVTA